MSNHRIFRCAISVILVLSMLISVCPMPAYAQEEVISVSFLIEKEAYSVDMKFEGDQLYCRADQWAEAAGCVWAFNSEQQKVLFYYEGPTILVLYNNETYIKDGQNMWVPFFDVATKTGVCFCEVSGNTIRGYRVTPLAVIYKDLDRMFNISQYRISEMILDLDEIWVLLDSASRAYAILSSFSLKGVLDAVSGKMDQDMYDAVLLDMLKTDDTLLGAITDLGDEINRPGKIINLLQKSLDEDGELVELLRQMDFSENDIREIVWDLSQEAYGNKTLNNLSDLYEANKATHFLEMLEFMDDMTISMEADIHSVMAMQEVFGNSDNVRMRQAAQKAISARVGDKVLAAGMYSLEFLGDVFWDQSIDKLDDLLKEATGTTSLSELGGKAFIWVLDKALSLTKTTDAIMYSDVYSLVQLELVNYYYRHINDTASDNGLMMHSVALLYLRACLASWKMFAFDDDLSQSIENATSTITAEITNLMRYTEEELLQNGTKKETEQTIIDFVKLLPDLLSQEKRFLEYLQNHPEYNYYAVLDVNCDGILELLATDRALTNYDIDFYVDLFMYENERIVMVREDIWAKYGSIKYDQENRWIETLNGGTSGYGSTFLYFDTFGTVQETSYDHRCYRVDESGNEIWTDYYNDEEVNDKTQADFDALLSKYENGDPKEIEFKQLPLPNMADFLGQDISVAVESIGNDYIDEYMDGGRCYTYDDIGVVFFFEDSDGNGTIVHDIMCFYDVDYGYGFSANMTYTEIVELAARYAEQRIPQPERYYSMIEERWEFALEFTINDIHYSYAWADDPDVTDSYEMVVSMPFSVDVETFSDDIQAWYGKASHTEFASCFETNVLDYTSSIVGFLTEASVDLDRNGKNEKLALISMDNSIYLQIYGESQGKYVLLSSKAVTSLSYCSQQNISIFYNENMGTFLLFVDEATRGAFTGNDSRNATIYELNYASIDLLCQANEDDYGTAKDDIPTQLELFSVPYAINCARIDNITPQSQYKELLEIEHRTYGADPLGGWLGREHHLQLITPEVRNRPVDDVQTWTITVQGYQGWTEYREETWTQEFKTGNVYTIRPTWKDGVATEYSVLWYAVDTQERTIEIGMDYPEGDSHWSGLVLDLVENTYYGLEYTTFH